MIRVKASIQKAGVRFGSAISESTNDNIFWLDAPIEHFLKNHEIAGFCRFFGSPLQLFGDIVSSDEAGGICSIRQYRWLVDGSWFICQE